jgi:type 1 glutamine amidotransferase
MSKFLFLTAFFVSSFLLAANTTNQSGQTKAIRALLVAGGCCHDYAQQKRILSEGLAARANVIFDVVHEGEAREHRVSIYQTNSWADRYDVIVHNECFGMVNDDSFVEAITRPHFAGKPAVMLHCSAHSYRTAKTDEWRKLLGVSSFSHEKRRDLEVVALKPEHPIMVGFPQRWQNPDDELYKVEKFWPTATALAQAYGVETKKDHPCIWINEIGKTRVFATTLGHQNSTMQSPVYLDLVTRGLLWSCGKLGNDGKPLPGYEPATPTGK